MLLMTVIRSSLWDSLWSALEKPCMLETVEENLPKMCVCVCGSFTFTVTLIGLSEYKGCSVCTCRFVCEDFENLALGEVWVKSAGVTLYWLKLKHRKRKSLWVRHGAKTESCLLDPTWPNPPGAAEFDTRTRPESEAIYLLFLIQRQSYMLALERLSHK